MKILAHHHTVHAVTDALPVLKDAVKEATGQHVRRIGRFIQMALIGAGHCTRGQPLPADTAVYLSSGRGDLEITLEVLADMVERGQPPKPLSFINTVSNSACFYVAKSCGLHGRSQFVTRRHAPLESALQLAALDFGTAGVRSALVGTVDIVTEPLADHRERLGLAPDAPVGEGSHWFHLAADDAPGEALAHITAVLTLADGPALAAWLRTQAPDGVVFAAGQHLDHEDARYWQTQAGIIRALDYRHGLPWYDSQAGAALAAFLACEDATGLLYMDTDPQGRFSVVTCQRQSRTR